jgi:F-box protein 11
LRDTELTLVSVPNYLKARIPIIVAQQNTTLNLTTCKLIGNQTGYCGGVILLNSNAHISDCNFVNLNAGCIYTIAKPYHTVTIQDCEIHDCKVGGIYVQGEGAQQVLQRNKIFNIEGSGVRINRGSCARVKGCEIHHCRNGIEVISAMPLIAMNELHRNIQNGILTKARNDLRCDAQIRFNSILKNKGSGIICTGKNNFSRIEKNLTIEQNKDAGIKCTDFASATICNNTIQSNYGQGILLVESSYAHIEKNVIAKNYKANIAFGGEHSCDTVILNNEIAEGRCEGVFALEAGYAWIMKN